MTTDLKENPLGHLRLDVLDEAGAGIGDALAVCELEDLSLRRLQHLAQDDDSVDQWFEAAGPEQREKIKRYRFGAALDHSFGLPTLGDTDMKRMYLFASHCACGPTDLLASASRECSILLLETCSYL